MLVWADHLIGEENVNGIFDSTFRSIEKNGNVHDIGINEPDPGQCVLDCFKVNTSNHQIHIAREADGFRFHLRNPGGDGVAANDDVGNTGLFQSGRRAQQTLLDFLNGVHHNLDRSWPHYHEERIPRNIREHKQQASRVPDDELQAPNLAFSGYNISTCSSDAISGRRTVFQQPLGYCWLVLVIAFVRPINAFADDAPRTDKPVAIGAKVGNLSFKDTRYLVRSLDDFKERKAFVLVFVDTSCPLVPRYLPTLKKLESEYRNKNVQFLGVNVGYGDTIVDLAALAIEHDVPFPFVKDTEGKCADALGVERTPEVVVLNAERKLRYRGRIDDQYLPGGGKPAPTRHDLKESLDEVLAGKVVTVSSTTVDGCRITRVTEAKPVKPVTYAEHVGPLLLQKCAACHKPGEAVPFSLLTYEHAKTRARAIAEVATDGKMPPWYAASAHGKFTNERKLTASERDLIRQWVQGGMQKGDDATIARLPKIEERKHEWRIGNPDLVLSTNVFELQAEGDIAYQYVVLPHLFANETWIQSIQILPDNPKVVHHCNLAYASIGKKFDNSNFITGLVPGAEPMQMQQGIAVRLPPASMLGLQIHFVATGKPEKCKIRVGVKFASGIINKQLRFFLFDGGRFSIPAQEPAYALKRNATLDCDAIGIGMFSHMHLRGKAMTFRAELPDGKSETLLMIPNFHFDWQIPYVWPEGKKTFPKGTNMECVAVYDNSAFNAFNPDPKAIVPSGQQTYHEMMNGFLFYVDANEKLNLDIDGKTGRVKNADDKRQ